MAILNLGVNVAILAYTVRILDMNQRSVRNSGNTARLLDEINDKIKKEGC